MCDYSLHLIASRPAKVADKLVSTDFVKSITRGFTEIGHPDVAVCLLPGTEVAFDDDVQYDRAFSMFGKARVEHRVARFRQVNMDDPHVHHDALEFPNGQIVMVTRLVPGQTATAPWSARSALGGGGALTAARNVSALQASGAENCQQIHTECRARATDRQGLLSSG